MDFHSLPRKELQALCKKNKIPANMTNVAMADALKALRVVEGAEDFQDAVSAVPSPQKAAQPEQVVPPPQPAPRRTATRRNAPADTGASMATEQPPSSPPRQAPSPQKAAPPKPVVPPPQPASRRPGTRRNATTDVGDSVVPEEEPPSPPPQKASPKRRATRAARAVKPKDEPEEKQIDGIPLIEIPDTPATVVVKTRARRVHIAPIPAELMEPEVDDDTEQPDEAERHDEEDHVDLPPVTPAACGAAPAPPAGRRMSTRAAAAAKESVQQPTAPEPQPEVRTNRRQSSRRPGSTCAKGSTKTTTSRAKGVRKMVDLLPDPDKDEKEMASTEGTDDGDIATETEQPGDLQVPVNEKEMSSMDDSNSAVADESTGKESDHMPSEESVGALEEEGATVQEANENEQPNDEEEHAAAPVPLKGRRASKRATATVTESAPQQEVQLAPKQQPDTRRCTRTRQRAATSVAGTKRTTRSRSRGARNTEQDVQEQKIAPTEEEDDHVVVATEVEQPLESAQPAASVAESEEKIKEGDSPASVVTHEVNTGTTNLAEQEACSMDCDLPTETVAASPVGVEVVPSADEEESTAVPSADEEETVVPLVEESMETEAVAGSVPEECVPLVEERADETADVIHNDEDNSAAETEVDDTTLEVEEATTGTHSSCTPITLPQVARGEEQSVLSPPDEKDEGLVAGGHVTDHIEAHDDATSVKTLSLTSEIDQLLSAHRTPATARLSTSVRKSSLSVRSVRQAQLLLSPVAMEIKTAERTKDRSRLSSTGVAAVESGAKSTRSKIEALLAPVQEPATEVEQPTDFIVPAFENEKEGESSESVVIGMEFVLEDTSSIGSDTEEGDIAVPPVTEESMEKESDDITALSECVNAVEEVDTTVQVANGEEEEQTFAAEDIDAMAIETPASCEIVVDLGLSPATTDLEEDENPMKMPSSEAQATEKCTGIQVPADHDELVKIHPLTSEAQATEAADACSAPVEFVAVVEEDNGEAAKWDEEDHIDAPLSPEQMIANELLPSTPVIASAARASARASTVKKSAMARASPDQMSANEAEEMNGAGIGTPNPVSTNNDVELLLPSTPAFASAAMASARASTARKSAMTRASPDQKCADEVEDANDAGIGITNLVATDNDEELLPSTPVIASNPMDARESARTSAVARASTARKSAANDDEELLLPLTPAIASTPMTARALARASTVGKSAVARASIARRSAANDDGELLPSTPAFASTPMAARMSARASTVRKSAVPRASTARKSAASVRHEVLLQTPSVAVEAPSERRTCSRTCRSSRALEEAKSAPRSRVSSKIEAMLTAEELDGAATFFGSVKRDNEHRLPEHPPSTPAATSVLLTPSLAASTAPSANRASARASTIRKSTARASARRESQILLQTPVVAVETGAEKLTCSRTRRSLRASEQGKSAVPRSTGSRARGMSKMEAMLAAEELQVNGAETVREEELLAETAREEELLDGAAAETLPQAAAFIESVKSDAAVPNGPFAVETKLVDSSPVVEALSEEGSPARVESKEEVDVPVRNVDLWDLILLNDQEELADYVDNEWEEPTMDRMELSSESSGDEYEEDYATASPFAAAFSQEAGEYLEFEVKDCVFNLEPSAAFSLPSPLPATPEARVEFRGRVSGMAPSTPGNNEVEAGVAELLDSVVMVTPNAEKVTADVAAVQTASTPAPVTSTPLPSSLKRSTTVTARKTKEFMVSRGDAKLNGEDEAVAFAAFFLPSPAPATPVILEEAPEPGVEHLGNEEEESVVGVESNVVAMGLEDGAAAAIQTADDVEEAPIVESGSDQKLYEKEDYTAGSPFAAIFLPSPTTGDQEFNREVVEDSTAASSIFASFFLPSPPHATTASEAAEFSVEVSGVAAPCTPSIINKESSKDNGEEEERFEDADEELRDSVIVPLEAENESSELSVPLAADSGMDKCIEQEAAPAPIHSAPSVPPATPPLPSSVKTKSTARTAKKTKAFTVADNKENSVVHLFANADISNAEEAATAGEDGLLDKPQQQQQQQGKKKWPELPTGEELMKMSMRQLRKQLAAMSLNNKQNAGSVAADAAGWECPNTAEKKNNGRRNSSVGRSVLGPLNDNMLMSPRHKC